MPMCQKWVMEVLTLKWARRPREIENGFEVISLCPLSIARTLHLHWPDTCGNNSGNHRFDMSCIVVLEALVSFLFSFTFLSIFSLFPSICIYHFSLNISTRSFPISFQLPSLCKYIYLNMW